MAGVLNAIRERKEVHGEFLMLGIAGDVYVTGIPSIFSC